VKRVHQTVLIASTLSWLAMMALHEFGHVLGAWLTGGRVAKVVLHPLSISRTDLGENPRPLVVVWAGPLFGAVAAVVFWIVTQWFGIAVSYLFRFFAGFCLMANGAYLGIGSFGRVGDAGDLLRHGAAPWHLWTFGAICMPAGFALWHRLGSHFGLGEAQWVVNIPTTYTCLAILIAGVTLMALFGGE
jgi:hypothetical protein